MIKGIISVGMLAVIAGAFTLGSVIMLMIQEKNLRTGIENVYGFYKARTTLISLLNSKINDKPVFELIAENPITDTLSNQIKGKLDKVLEGECYKLIIGEDKIIAQSEKECEFNFEAKFKIPVPGQKSEDIRLLL